MKRHFTALLLSVLFVPVLLHARVEGHFDRTLSVSGATSLDLTTGSGDVTVKSGSGNQVVIHATIHGNNEWFSSNAEGAVHQVESNPPIQQSGNTIRIGYNLPEDVKRHVSISYDVTVPADTTVQAHSGSGNLNLQGLRSGVEATTGSGDIQLRDLGSRVSAHTGSGSIRGEDVAAAFNAHTGSGDIEAQLAGSGDVDVQTGSGGVRLRGIKGAAKIRTGSGDIQADGDVKGPWALHTGSGGVRMAVGANDGFNLNVHTSSGSIHSDLPITVQGSLGRRELKGTVRGGGPEVEVSTGSGDVEIR
jgi:DUF4097 and DUF4098 domain-containing protein YvlB